MFRMRDLWRLFRAKRDKAVLEADRRALERSAKRTRHALEEGQRALEALKDSDRLDRATELVQRQRDQQGTYVAQMEAALADARRVIQSLETALAETRAKLTVHESTIETLVAANRVHLARYDAEVAIETRRQVAAMPGKID